MLTIKEVAKMIDHTNLKAYATTDDFKKLCDEAVNYGFKSVAINTYPVKICRKMLEGTDVLTGAAIGFPLGQMTIETKVAEARNAVKDGCQEFDYVLNVGKVKEHDYDYIEEEMKQMVVVARTAGICAKVIFETCYLTEEEIIEVAKIASRVKPDFVKTSTGFGTAGAKVEHVRLMKQYAGNDVQVKAAGGIRSWQDAKAMIEAGATRLGTSSGIKIIEEMKIQIQQQMLSVNRERYIPIDHLEEIIAYLKNNPEVKFDSYPDYDGKVFELLASLGVDMNYMEKHDQIDDKKTEDMTLDDLRVMFTFIQRSERFSTGSIGGYINDGTLLKLAERELELLSTVE